MGLIETYRIHNAEDGARAVAETLELFDESVHAGIIEAGQKLVDLKNVAKKDPPPPDDK